MVKKFIRRKDGKIIDRDDGTYLTQIGSKLEIKEPMDVQDRSITFGIKKESQNIVKHDPTTEKIRWALDAAGNTGLAIKFFNLKVDKQKSQIKKFKEFQERFDREVALLQGYKLDKIRYDKKNISNLDVKQLTELFDQLLLEKRITKRRLQIMHNELSAIESDVKQQEKEIEQVRKTLAARVFDGEDSEGTIEELEAVQTVRDEVKAISKQYDTGKLTQALETVLSPNE